MRKKKEKIQTMMLYFVFLLIFITTFSAIQESGADQVEQISVEKAFEKMQAPHD